jgi:hypothetical protein
MVELQPGEATQSGELTMAKYLQWFLMGLFGGMGFHIAGAVLKFIGSLISRS